MSDQEEVLEVLNDDQFYIEKLQVHHQLCEVLKIVKDEIIVCYYVISGNV